MAKTQEQQDALALIALKLKSVNKLILECEVIADDHQVSFRVSGPTYGCGATYEPISEDRPEKDENGEDFDGWYASSQSC